MLLRASHFTHLAGSRFPKFSVFHYGGDKAKSVYSTGQNFWPFVFQRAKISGKLNFCLFLKPWSERTVLQQVQTIFEKYAFTFPL